jgi:exodeoxyribonuclease VII large subunit
VIHDFLRALRRRFRGVEVVVWDARVQGEGAWREIVRGLHLLDADPTIDAIVLARGGGSLEDLWNFNREELVRAVFEASTPVVSAVGHETDWVLTDLVADARAATPTAAAALVVPDAGQLLQRIDELELRMQTRVQGVVRELAHRLEALRRGLVHPARRLRESALHLRELRQRLAAAALRARERATAHFAGLAGRLHALSPLAVLARGFSLTLRESDGAIVRAAGQARTGEAILVQLARGRLRATVRESLED